MNRSAANSRQAANAGRAEPTPRDVWRWVPIGLGLVFLSAIACLGFLYVQRMKAAASAEALKLLHAVVDLKVRQIVQWRKERWADADLVHGTPYAARRAMDVMAQPTDNTRRTFTIWLSPLLGGHAYEQALLWDGQFRILLAHPSQTPILTPPLRIAAEQAMKSRQVTDINLHSLAEGGPAYLGFAVPFIVRRESGQDRVPASLAYPSPADRSAAVLTLLIDSRSYLSPLLRAWPTPSPSGETYLVRRHGDSWLCLTGTRGGAQDRVTLRLPAKAQVIPGCDGLKATTGLAEGLDYRGVPVLAVAQAVPGTDWMLVAKVDRNEVYADLRRQAWMVWSSLGLLGAVTVLGGALFWRRHEANALRERLRGERERLAQAARLQHLLKNANDVILLADQNQRIVEANDRTIECYGYSAEELTRMRLPELRAEAAESQPAGATQPAKGSDFIETLHRRKDGSTFAVEGSIRRVEIDQTVYHLAILRDVTERKRLEARLREAQKLESVGQLAGGVAHHFNNILTAVLLQLELLRLSPPPDPATREALRDIEAGANRAAKLTRELLTFARRMTLQVKPLDLNEMVTRLLPRLRGSAKPSAAPIQIEFQPQLGPAMVAGDAEMLEQVVLTLSANACEAMPSGGRVTVATATVEVLEGSLPSNLDLRPGSFVRLEVSDTGRGMDSATLKRLFEPFFTTKEVGAGTGLGLASVYGIAILHKGWVDVESQPGHGSCFRLFIPAAAAATSPPS